MSASRQRPALGPPPADLSKFPRSKLSPDAELYRAHTVANSQWWFSSNLSGRFDVNQPNGTCYLATDTASALRERFGHDLVRQGVVTFRAAARTQVSKLQVPSLRWLANTCSPRVASFGMTREIGTCPSYKFPQAWAAGFFGGRKHSGIRYQSRFSTGPKPNSVALFDLAGQQGWPTDPNPIDGVQACTNEGIRVERAPTRRQVQIVQPPE
ncbi:RES family NAD+ phosphorylase [Mycobacterium sp.]|uniref:RES family NAD+ phosphorylase n=1 Tax=Mycobacterium sp. TaxID=1785 RepID=UPI003D6B8D92